MLQVLTSIGHVSVSTFLLSKYIKIANKRKLLAPRSTYTNLLLGDTDSRKFIGKCSHVLTQFNKVREVICAVGQCRLKIFQLRASLALDINCYLYGFVKKFPNLNEIFLSEASGSESRASHTNSTRGHCRHVSRHCVLVCSNISELKDTLHTHRLSLDSSWDWLEPMIVSSTTDQMIAIGL